MDENIYLDIILDEKSYSHIPLPLEHFLLKIQQKPKYNRYINQVLFAYW